jgi:hypothetical protein
MAIAVYVLCALTSLACAVLLLRGYVRSKVTMLLWSGLCFVGLAINNGMLSVDVMLGIDLTLWRKLPALIGVVLLLHGLIGESK